MKFLKLKISFVGLVWKWYNKDIFEIVQMRRKNYKLRKEMLMKGIFNSKGLRSTVQISVVNSQGMINKEMQKSMSILWLGTPTIMYDSTSSQRRRNLW